MKAYTLGFLFDEQQRWLGVLKEHGPPVNIGKWNGIGGKIEPNETPGQAMAREGLEEIGSYFSWHLRGSFTDQNTFFVHVFQATHVDEPLNMANDIGETLNWLLPVWNYATMAYNLGWMLPLIRAEHVKAFKVTE